MEKKKNISERRKTKGFFISVEAGYLKTVEEGVVFAEKVRDTLKKWCKSYGCSAEIVIFICDEKPLKKRSADDEKVDPHLHILLFANPGSTARAKVVDYIEKKLNCPFVHVQLIYDMVALKMYLNQFENYRTAAKDFQNLPEFAASRYRSSKDAIMEDIDNFLKEIEDIDQSVKEIKKGDFWTFLSDFDALNADSISVSWFDVTTI